jgi:hypothetical protein
MPAAVAALLARISEWRQNRTRRTAMPAELWEEATRLGREYGAYPVARDLNLHYERLKRRVAGLPVGRSRAPRAGAEFVELRAVTVTGVESVSSATTREFVTELEMTRPGGGMVRVRQTGPEGMDLVGLAAACFGKR